MADVDLSDQIARLETDIEQLADRLDRCRKAILLSKIAIAAGAILISTYFLGAIGFDPTILIGAIAAIIGGVVALGSNSSTSNQTMTAIRVAATRKAELIDTVEFRIVGEGSL
jgi:hypothetical protein